MSFSKAKIAYAQHIAVVMHNLSLYPLPAAGESVIRNLCAAHREDVLQRWAAEAQKVLAAQLAFSEATKQPITGKTKIVYNKITGDGKTPIVLEVGTPSYCDPSTETYHSM